MSTSNVLSTPQTSGLPLRNSLGGWLGAASPRIAPALPCLLTLAGVAVCTWILFILGQNLGSVGFIYLVFVVLASLYGGFWQATLVSVVAVACLDFFFEDPIFSFSVARLSNWVELGAFEFTALIVTQLSNRAHLREMEAVSERRDTARLYQTARRILLSEAPGDRATWSLRCFGKYSSCATRCCSTR